MQTTTINARQIPPITLDRVAEVATAELEAFIALLADLDDRDWARPTDCAGWTVHDLTAHLVGQYQGLAKLSVFLRRHRRAHRRYPALLRRQRIGRMYPDDRLGYVLDVLGLRDLWMHRVDLARATGRPLALGAHDRVVVAQVIADLGWAWEGPPVLLERTGRAGGRWTLGQGAPVATARVVF